MASVTPAQARAQAPIAIRYEIESNQVAQGESFAPPVIVTTATDAALDERALHVLLLR